MNQKTDNFEFNTGKIDEDERCEYCVHRNDLSEYSYCDDCKFRLCNATTNTDWFTFERSLSPIEYWESLTHKCLRCAKCEHEFRGDQLWIKIVVEGVCLE
jgi:hypothetical protein